MRKIKKFSVVALGLALLITISVFLPAGAAVTTTSQGEVKSHEFVFCEADSSGTIEKVRVVDTMSVKEQPGGGSIEVKETNEFAGDKPSKVTGVNGFMKPELDGDYIVWKDIGTGTNSNNLVDTQFSKSMMEEARSRIPVTISYKYYFNGQLVSDPKDIEGKTGLTFRWPKGETRDAYAQLGTFSFPGGNNNYLAWLQVEEVAHPLGKSRTCGSCHDSETQVAHVTWRYYDSQGAEPFEGRQRVVADKSGLHVKDIKATSKIKLMEGGKIENFAAWMKLGDIWKTRGDFSIPKSDPVKYRNFDRGVKEALARFDKIDKDLKAREAKGENVKKLRRRWKEAKAAAVHEPGSIIKISK